MSETQVKKTSKKPNPADRFGGPGPGRPKGSENKFTNLKQSFLDVFEKIEEEGKKEGSQVKDLFTLATKSERNQMTFYQIISKMLPSNVTVDGEMKLMYLISEKVLPEISKDNDDTDV